MKENKKKLAGESVLPLALTEALLLGAAPTMPPRDRAQALRAKVLAAARQTDVGQLHTVRAQEGAWHPIAPLVDMKLLHDDGVSRSVLIRLQAGARLPPHDHAADEECIVLEGEGSIGDIFLRAGDYHLAPKGMRHGETYTATGALLFIRSTALDYRAGV
ncbi:MAG: cupin domain-containing protein [Pseudomonadota bacterium]